MNKRIFLLSIPKFFKIELKGMPIYLAKSLKSGSKLYLSLVNSQALFITGRESIKTPSK